MTQRNVGGVVLSDVPYIIGAGVCKTPASTEKWLQIAPVASGSYTRGDGLDGNTGKVMWPETLELFLEAGGGLNSYGMPNMGFAKAAEQIWRIESDQPLIVNIAGFSVDGYVAGVKIFSAINSVAAIELNFGCPNTQGEHPDIMSFNPGVIRKIFETIIADGLTTKPIWPKFSPYSNPAELKRMAKIVNEFKDHLQLAVVTCNTFANAYAGEGKIGPNDGMAGLSGPAMKMIALGQVRQFRQHLDPSIDVIGVGGITTGDDIMDFLDAGASAVQITSLAHWAGDPPSFSDHLLKEETSDRFLEYLSNNI
jgi:dihydroorotate dehydrogenase (fumarate)